jgi:hypothetical protein
MNLRNRITYLRYAGRALAQRPTWETFAFALRYAHRCIDSCERGQPDFLAEATPWMCFPAVERLDQLLTAQSKVFEYGSGGSTIYFARRVAEVVSVEHDRAWHGRVQLELERRGLTNVHCKLVEPAVDTSFNPTRIADPSAYVSSDERYLGKTFRSYAQAIDAFPDHHFDLVVVDGRARPSCMRHARQKVRPGGVLLLDQSERGYYLAKTAPLFDPAQWRSTRYMAPQPYTLLFTEATFFTRTDQ